MRKKTEDGVGSDLKTNRVLAVEAELNWPSQQAKDLYNTISKLCWDEAYYRNTFSRRLWAERMGFRVDPSKGDPHDITKQGRQEDTGMLASNAYSAAEVEARAAIQRDGKKIYCGQPLPEWKPSSALSVTGRKIKKDSGVKLEYEDGQYVIYLHARSRECPEGTRVRIPIKKNTKRDEFQGAVLDGMVAWTIPIGKATVQLKRAKIIIRLCYERQRTLPAMGERIATIGPVRDGRFICRTETQSQDYSSKLAQIIERKQDWDLIRRRATRQIGWRKGHARAKRRLLARLTWDDWCHTFLHTWSRQLVLWCYSQGVGTIRIAGLGGGDWPAAKFRDLVKYKAEDCGMKLEEGADIRDASGERAAKAIVQRQRNKAKKRGDAVRELEYQLGEN